MANQVKTTSGSAEKAKPAKPTAQKQAPKKIAAKKPSPKTQSPIKKQPPLKKQAPLKKQVGQVKEPIMAKTPEFSKSMTDAMSEAQTHAKAAYEKSTEMAGEVSALTKENVEAVVESGKILSAGVQELGKSYAEEAKSAFEVMTADMKEMAAIKSPTEMFQLQGKLMRRNFETLLALGSKSSETAAKLANDTMSPISARMSVTAEKFSKVA